MSINTLLGAPRKLICQCCGMPLEDDEIISHDSDGALNEDYCKWCYADGTYTYSNMDDLIDVCVKNMINENFTEEQVRAYMKDLLPKLDYWKRYEELGDNGEFEEFKKQLIQEINDLHIEGMPKVEKLNALVGKYVNLEYPLPNGKRVKLLDDQTTYLGNQLEWSLAESGAFGVLAGMDFIMVCTYEAEAKIRSWWFIRRDKKISCIKKSQETGSFLRANQGQHISGNFVHSRYTFGEGYKREFDIENTILVLNMNENHAKIYTQCVNIRA